MKAHRVSRDDLNPATVPGRLLAHDLRDREGRLWLGKGTALTEAHAAVISEFAWSELHLLEVESHEVPEDVAGRRLANAICGHGVLVGDWSEHWPLRATGRGIVRIDARTLEELNRDDAACAYSLYEGQVVDEGEVVARAKIIPFAIASEAIERIENLAGRARAGGGVVQVGGFSALSVGAVVQESLGERAAGRFRDTLREKVAWLGSPMIDPVFVPAEAGAVAAGLRAVLDLGASVIALAGTRSMDPLDPAFEAVRASGGRMVRHGMPAHPGSLCWVARVGTCTIVGMPTCGLFSRATVFDLLLPRLLAGDALDPPFLASLGHGGFLTREMAYRFPPYRREAARGATEPLDD